MASVVADTHALVWYLSRPGELSPAALAAMVGAAEAGDLIHVSAISLVELVYLVERGRIAQGVFDALWSELHDAESVLMLVPVDAAIARKMETVPRDQVPDMPDRIIAATALALGLPLVTRDHKIRAADVATIW